MCTWCETEREIDSQDTRATITVAELINRSNGTFSKKGDRYTARFWQKHDADLFCQSITYRGTVIRGDIDFERETIRSDVSASGFVYRVHVTVTGEEQCSCCP